MPPPPNNAKVSSVASSLALTPRRIQQLVKEKILPAPDNGNYDLKACIIAYKKYLQMQSDRRAGNIIANNGNKNKDINSDHNSSTKNTYASLNTERLRLLSAQANKAELEVAVLEGKYIAAGEIELAWSRVLIAFRARMLSMPTNIARSIVALGGDIAAVTNLLESEINSTLQELSNYRDESRDENSDVSTNIYNNIKADINIRNDAVKGSSSNPANS